jgi:nucleotide-binding universal stress UspA family protein
MSSIICATRGGAGSRAVQQRAIQIAQENGHLLIFLYVIDISNLRVVDEGVRKAVREELRWLGLTLLLIARKRADSAQIDSEIIIREGVVRDEIIKFIDEKSDDLLLLGAPRGTTDTVAGDDLIEQFAKSIENESGVTVEIVRPESLEEYE